MISDIGRPLVCVSSCSIVIARFPSTSKAGRNFATGSASSSASASSRVASAAPISGFVIERTQNTEPGSIARCSSRSRQP